MDVDKILFVDVDVLVLSNFWDMAGTDYFDKSCRCLILSKDLFVGYKEKMENEFKLVDPKFRMKYFSDGDYFYFNTGVFFASRNVHTMFFDKCTEEWINYIKITGLYPSIFDQNIFNYCLIKYNMDIEQMPITNNCLRQYNPLIYQREVLLNGRKVMAMHFNGGDAEIKYQRWINFLLELRV